MRKTSESVYPLIKEQIDALKDVNEELHATACYIVDQRDTNLLLRPFLIRLTYELCGGTEWEKIIPVGAAFELLNISSYQANSAFDNKHRIFSSQQKDSQFIASMLTREMAADVLDTARSDFSGEIIHKLMQDLSVCNKNMYLAQHYDLNMLTISNLKYYNDEDVYFDAYMKRGYLGCGIFTGLCARAGGFLAQGDSDSLKALVEFGKQFGTALQIVNDLADFVPPGLGTSSRQGFPDRFSDLRNGRLTLGCYRLIRSGVFGKNLLKRIEGKVESDEQDYRDISEFLGTEGIVNEIIERTTTLELAANKALEHFSDSPAKDYLSQMLTVCHSNKFTKALSKAGGI